MIYENELSQWRLNFLKTVLSLGAVSLGFFAYTYHTQGNVYVFGLDLGLSMIMVLTVILLNFGVANYLFGTIVGWLGILTILLTVLFTGGIGYQGLIWWGLLPMLSFMFFGLQRGLLMFALGWIVVFVVFVAESIGMEISYFDKVQLRQATLMLGVFGMIMYVYESVYKNLISKVIESGQQFQESQAEKKILDLELKKRLDDLALKSQKDQRIRQAVINILEDERELEKKLKEEKESVEKKIVERTEELNKERGRLFEFLKSIPQGVFVLDAKGTPYFANKRAEEILGLGVKKVGKNDLTKTYSVYKAGTETLYPTDEQPSVLALEGKKMTVNDMEIDRGGVRIPIRVSGAPIYDSKGGIEFGIVVFEDITEEVVLNRSKDEFFSIASHELRTPLTAIRGNTEMILDNYKATIKNKDVLEMLGDIHEGSIRLIEIVNDFLNISRLEMKKIDFKIERFDLVKLLKKTIDEFKDANLKPALELKLQVDQKNVEVLVDSDRFEQVIINLLGNAYKFTEKGGVYFENLEVVDGLVTVDVRDTGAGIAKEQQSLLFRKFQQAGDSLYTRDTSKGTGLGLYISKMLMEGMGGKIWLKSSETGKGSVFSFSIPLAK